MNKLVAGCALALLCARSFALPLVGETRHWCFAAIPGACSPLLSSADYEAPLLATLHTILPWLANGAIVAPADVADDLPMRGDHTPTLSPVSAGPALLHHVVLRSARSDDVVHRLSSAVDQLRQYAEYTPISSYQGELVDPAMTPAALRAMDDDTWIGVPGTLALDSQAASLTGTKITEHDLTALALTPLLPYGIEIFHAVRRTSE